MDFACARMGMRSSASVYNKRSTLYDACEQRNAMRCDWRKGKGGGGGDHQSALPTAAATADVRSRWKRGNRLDTTGASRCMPSALGN